jgi:hypothetical protein
MSKIVAYGIRSTLPTANYIAISGTSEFEKWVEDIGNAWKFDTPEAARKYADSRNLYRNIVIVQFEMEWVDTGPAPYLIR